MVVSNGKPHSQTRRVNNNRDYAGYTFGYNQTLLAHRVQDVMTLVAFIRGYDEHPTKKIHLIAMDGSSPVAAVTRALAGDAIDRSAIDVSGFQFANLKSWRDPDFLPGAIKYGDISGILASADSDNPLLLGRKKANDIAQTFARWIQR